ncbi:hypothetical protein FOZ62_006383 [Perkinsus olseni]|uniref:Uncharacterized protein n=1 Tax=Perkinsus olseni TaxID=32597 RepID=A0A7J6TF50_PEROL|nr:hypothetical protein FOZ62_006383 [Perkinsus olseni]
MTERNMLTFWMSFIPIVSSVSSFAGPFLGGIVAQADTSEPLNPAYAGLALNAASFLLVLLFMRKSPRDGGFILCTSRRSEVASSVASKPSNIAGPLVEWKAACLWFLLCGLSSAGTQGWSVLLVTIQRELGLSSLVLGSISGWCGLMIITGQLLVLPFLFHRLKFSEGAVVVFGFALAPFIIILGFVTDVWATVAIGSLFALGVPLTMTMGFATFSRLCDPSKKSLIMGLLALSLNSSKVVSILLAGVLYDVNKSAPYIMVSSTVVSFPLRKLTSGPSRPVVRQVCVAARKVVSFRSVILRGHCWHTRGHRYDEDNANGREKEESCEGRPSSHRSQSLPHQR